MRFEAQYGLLQDLIQTKSYSGEEGPILTLIESHLQEHGIHTLRQDSNLLIHFQGKNREKALIFDGHVDTVSADEEAWGSVAPFGSKAGNIIDGEIFGLGASDMKSGVYTQIIIAESIHSYGEPPCDIWIAFVTEEETSGKGSSSFVDWFFSQKFGYKEIGVIIPEPTDLNKLFIGQRGNYSLKAQVIGDTGHASQPDEGMKNSILLMDKFLRNLQEKVVGWKTNYQDELFGSPAVTVTAINGGDFTYPNKLAPICNAALDIRTNPQFHLDALRLIQEAGKEFDVTLEELWPAGPSLAGDPKSKLVLTMQDVTHLQPSIHTATTDVGWFLNRGISQAVIYGPGHYSQSHKPKEYIMLDNVNRAIEQYKQVIVKWGI